MASKILYSVVAVAGIAAASGAAWWYQSQPRGPQEIKATSAPGAGPTAAAPAGAASAARPAGVEVAQVARATLQDDAQTVGSLRSRQSVMMRPEVPGRVREIGFTDGGSVRRGQLLVQLDDTLQRAEVRQAQAQVSIAQANFKRNQELVAQSFVAQRVLEESSANLQVAEAQLSLSCARLARMAIIAPFDGTVGIRNINLGDFVKDGADLINLEDIASMYVDFRLPERFQTKVRLRQVVELQLDSMPGRIFKATVEAIDPLLDVNGRSVGVRAVLPNSQGEPMLQPGGRPGAAGPGGPGGQDRRPGSAAGKPDAAAKAAGVARPAAQASRPTRPASAPAAVAAGGTVPANRAAGTVALDANGCPVLPGALAAAAPAARPTEGSGAQGAAVARSSAAETRPAAASGGAAAAGARPPGNPAPLRPGMFARVTAIFAIKDMALVVPEEAIVPQGGRQFVIKVVAPADLPEGQNRPVLPPDTKLVSLRQEVKLGARQLGRVEVTEGLIEGDTIVVAGQQRLQRDGSPLRVVEIGRPVPGLGIPGGGAPATAAVSAPVSAASR
ncbi:MAG: efflux RND transporter periplasmic adaptor subunit [Rhodoferax sp.]|nr:efflux RND transporter periplasmic adaptor subunit [Rhodoferax sp.]